MMEKKALWYAFLILLLFGSLTIISLLELSTSQNVSAARARNGMIGISRIIVGVDYWAGFSASSFTDRDLSFLKEAGIRIIRLEFGKGSETNLTILVSSITANEIEILGLLMRKDLVGDGEAWGHWVYNTVSTYKDKVKVWEIWNEPNWGTGFQDDPVGYTEFLKRAYIMAKQADPNCTILGGSILGTHDAGLNYLSSMYDNGARDYMDAVAIHPYSDPYSPESPNVNSWGSGFWRLQYVRDLMVERGDENKKIWVTEVGWATGGMVPTTEEEQALYLTQALNLSNSWDWLETFILYSWMDSKSANLYYGIVREKYSPPYTHENFCKLSFFAVKEFITQG